MPSLGARQARMFGATLGAVALCAAAFLVVTGPVPGRDWLRHPVDSLLLSRGENPHPVVLRRPASAPLSAMARLGRRIFFDPSLSSSKRLACASCHDPRHAYGPPGGGAVMEGGAHLDRPGARAVPSLMYLERQPAFSIGPDNEENENVNLAALARRGQALARPPKTARNNPASARRLVPQGGLFWDGRADTLQAQAMGPLLNPVEMDGGSVARVASRLARAPYAAAMRRLFGPGIFNQPAMAVAEAMFAVARYQIEDPSFHPYASRFDSWLEGKARLSREEIRGYLLFNDPAKGDCAACHPDRPTPDGRPPLFTDHQYEALGVPRNPAIAANRDPAWFDLGLCGPFRPDLAAQTGYCGLFLTPTLRNVATRRVFFHNGVYHSLDQVLDFYNFRDTRPQRVYPLAADGQIRRFDDLPARLWANVDHADPPLNRRLGQTPALTRREERAIVAFLKTLTDRSVRHWKGSAAQARASDRAPSKRTAGSHLTGGGVGDVHRSEAHSLNRGSLARRAAFASGPGRESRL